MTAGDAAINRVLDMVLRLNEKAFAEREECAEKSEKYYRLSGEILAYSKVCAQLIELGQ
jgi:hypothetical protein